MDYLYNLNLNEDEILDMVKVNDHISEMSSEDIYDYIYTLIDIGCNQEQIHNIIIANPFYFSRDLDDVRKFLRRFMSFDGVKYLDVLAENPWLLNKEAFEIEDYIEENKNTGLNDKEILERFIRSCF